MDEKRSAQNHECRVLIAGVGNGGCSAVAAMARQWKDGPPIAGINTDVQDLAKVAGLRRIQIGAQVMKGMGTGGDPRVGRRAAAADVETIRELFHDVNLVFFIVGLGGGVGTGAAPLVVEEARKAGALTLCFAMMPFEFEGQRRMDHAQHGLRALEDAADGVICLPNQRLVEMMEDRTNIAEAFRKADAMLYRGVQSVWRVICRQGVINLDFADVRTLLQEGNGQCVFGCAEGSGPDRIEMALKAIREDPLLKHGQVMANAHSYIVSIMGGMDLALKDVDFLMRGIADIGRPNALAMAGVSCDPELQDKVFVTILAAESEAQDRQHSPSAEADIPLSHAVASDEERRDQKIKLTQGTLFDEAGQGRFKGIDPTIVEGSNLDIPTFIRRGIMIQKVRK
ncbi:MAG: cell division FtsZ family protein [Verrucomicrobia bacterium]|nr:cell division FtsZ family protein [Verrucomicrobiota bacterium]MBU4248587.1 cell division FtsZ family protein [Verrucomicrobiota bacterium]MBU4290527.1 cell division FtsZ family protein [Verrucomicrobiota bacterium]MBU4429140.1 cell division FtsZ family protein [Verrucomicrobiota bacterium]MCG2680706.1 cell division FtsZ family protein [Kiritimatiellia bacterium]